ncbi:uncharacterized protein NMK_2432 [Novimethylophilus kurashikiensis]|uniref:Uncharacterized protein n=1 Tax=Novimethylophilus kurashikiensis TaxID=1825523 RepID=A0A2R5FE43_9PROT|nr:hypothetical protein [Novimethylophilus kurashikiensis]GBG14831.1 uncharacterized protein NMK_2432 [Novimethylophilus kurashikiensis]
MAKLDIGIPLIYRERFGIESSINHIFECLVPGIRERAAYKVVKHKNGLFIHADKDATEQRFLPRCRASLEVTFKVLEVEWLEGFVQDGVMVGTSTGILFTSRDKLPVGWDLDAIPELPRSMYSRVLSNSKFSHVAPITGAGIVIPEESVSLAGVEPGTLLYGAYASQPNTQIQRIVLSKNPGAGVPLNLWDGKVVRLPLELLDKGKHCMSMHVLSVPNLGWVLQASNVGAEPEKLLKVAMPDLSHEKVIGKHLATVCKQRGHIRYADIGHIPLRAAGFEAEECLYSERMACGAIKISRAKQGEHEQKIRYSRRDGEDNVRLYPTYRVGERQLTWIQAQNSIQVIAVEGALYLLPAEVENEIPLIKVHVPRDYSPVDITLGNSAKTLTIPAKVLHAAGFTPGKQFKVTVRNDLISLTPAEDSNWTVGKAANDPVVALPRDLCIHLSTNKLTLVPRSGSISIRPQMAKAA